MPDAAPDPQATPALPDMYTPSQQLLSLLSLGLRALLTRPKTRCRGPWPS
jgi:hypothetical protein